MFGFARASKVRELEERLEKAERDLRALGLEAADLYEKARHALGRASKRMSNGSSPEVNGDDGAPEGRPAHIDPKSWGIILRRKGGVGPTNRG
jgi:hypothetical protein